MLLVIYLIGYALVFLYLIYVYRLTGGVRFKQVLDTAILALSSWAGVAVVVTIWAIAYIWFGKDQFK